MNPKLYEKFNETTKESFQTWLSTVKEQERIHTRLPFTTLFPECRFLELKEKQTKDEKGNDITVGSQKAKMRTESGKDIGYKFQSPSVLAQRGFTRGKTKNGGEVESVAVIYDVRNPEHKHFMDEFDRSVVEPCLRMIVKEPGSYKIDTFAPITDADPTQNPEFAIAKRLAMAKMAKIFRFPMKDAKSFDLLSPYRYFYYNPMDYQDPDDLTKPASKMKVYLSLNPSVPPIEISPDELLAMCEGWDFVDGKLTKKEPKGFECSPEGYVQKLHVGAGLSIKVLCSSIVITRFFTSPKINSQAEKLDYFAKNGTVDNTFTSLDELLSGLKGTVNKAPVDITSDGGSFNPMGGETSQLPSVNTQGSLLATATGYNQQTVQSSVKPEQQQNSIQSLPTFIQPQSVNQLPPPATQTNISQFMNGSSLPSNPIIQMNSNGQPLLSPPWTI